MKSRSGKSLDCQSTSWKVGISKNSSWLLNFQDQRSGSVRIQWGSFCNRALKVMPHASRFNAVKIGLSNSLLHLKMLAYSSSMEVISQIRTSISLSGSGEEEAQTNLNFFVVRKMMNGLRFLEKENQNPMLKQSRCLEFSNQFKHTFQSLIICKPPLMDRRQFRLTRQLLRIMARWDLGREFRVLI